MRSTLLFQRSRFSLYTADRDGVIVALPVATDRVKDTELDVMADLEDIKWLSIGSRQN